MARVVSVYTRSYEGCSRGERIAPSRHAVVWKHRCRSRKADNRTEDELVAGRSVYTPDSFEEIVVDACGAVSRALEKGEKRMEVEFPPLPPSISDYKGSSDDFIDANIQLALTAAGKLTSKEGKRVQLLFPDAVEFDRARNMFDFVLQSDERLSAGYTGKGILKALRSRADPNAETDNVDLFIILNHSTSELSAMRGFVEEVIQERPVLLWNLELETLKADLGLFGFPPKSLHYEFLSQFKSIFFLRLRDYSKTITVAPFLFNYSGALFREYPGPWQVMLKKVDGQYVCVAEDRVRYTLFEVKETLTSAMGLDTEKKGSVMSFLRRGYKRSTWWEEDLENEKSRNWRS